MCYVGGVGHVAALCWDILDPVTGGGGKVKGLVVLWR